MDNNFGLDTIDSGYLDVLKEIGNIGAGNATTALAQMLQRKVDIKVPKAELLNFRDVGEAIGGEETIMAGVYMMVEGDIEGSMMFLLEKKSAKHLIDHMLGSYGTSDSEEFNEMEISVLKEMGNIMTGAYLNSLSELTNLKILPSPPDAAVDMAGAILSVPAIEFATMGDKMLMIQTRFTDDVAIDGFFVLVPDVDSYRKIMGSLGMA